MSALPKILITLQQELAEKRTKEAAWAVVEEYFSFFGKERVQNDLWLLTAGALSSEHIDEMEKACKRHDTLFFYEYTKMLIEAMHLIWEQHEQRKRFTS